MNYRENAGVRGGYSGRWEEELEPRSKNHRTLVRQRRLIRRTFLWRMTAGRLEVMLAGRLGLIQQGGGQESPNQRTHYRTSAN